MFNLFRKRQTASQAKILSIPANVAVTKNLSQSVETIGELPAIIETQEEKKQNQELEHYINQHRKILTDLMKKFSHPFANFDIDFIKQLKDIDKPIFRELYPAYDVDTKTLLGKLKFDVIMQKEYNQESIYFRNAINRSEHTLLRLQLILNLKDKDWWTNLLAESKDVTLINQISLIRAKVKKMLDEQDIYAALSMDALYRLHMHYQIIIRTMNEELSMLKESKTKLTQRGAHDWYAYLAAIKNIITEETAKINQVILTRLLESSSYRSSIIEDDPLHWVCHELMACSSLIHLPQNIQNFASGYPRTGLDKSKYRYFVKHFTAENLQKISTILPVEVLQHVEKSGFWEKLPNWLTTGRRQRANFIVDHIYDLIDIKIETKYLVDKAFKIQALDNIENVKYFQKIINAEKAYDALIKKVEREKPRGLWSVLFKQKTQQLFDTYTAFLQDEKSKINTAKGEFYTKLNDFSRKDKSMIHDMYAVSTLRKLLKENKMKEGSFFDRTNFLKELLNDLVTPGTDNMIKDRNRWLPKISDIDDIISIIKNFVKDDDQVEALRFLHELILGIPNTHLQADIEYIKTRLKPLVDVIDVPNLDKDSVQFFDKIVDNWIIPRCPSVHSNEFKFLEKNYPYKAQHWIDSMSNRVRSTVMKLTDVLKKWPDLSQDGRLEIYNSIDFMLDISWKKSINYYQRSIDIIKNYLHVISVENIEKYADIIDKINNKSLTFLYQIKKLKLNDANIEEVILFVTDIIKNNKINLPLDQTDADIFYNILLPYQHDWHNQQEFLIRRFAHSHLQNYYTDRIIAAISCTDEVMTHADLQHAYPADIVALIYGKTNFIRLLNEFEKCLERNCRASSLKIMADLLPPGIERLINVNDTLLSERIERLRMRIKDKEQFNKLKTFYQNNQLNAGFNTDAKKLIDNIQKNCPNYPLTAEGNDEFSSLIGKYDRRVAQQQHLFYCAFGKGHSKQQFYATWIKDQLDNGSTSDIIDILPDHCSADDILNLYQQNDQFYLYLYTQIANYLETPHMEFKLLPLIKKHLPEGMANKFIHNEILFDLIEPNEVYLKENIVLMELASLHNHHASLNEVNQFIKQHSHAMNPINLTVPFFRKKYHTIISQHILPYDANWCDEQQLLLSAFEPAYLTDFYGQWLTGLLQGTHQNIDSNPFKNPITINTIFEKYGINPYFQEIIPTIYSYLKEHRVITDDIHKIIKLHLPTDFKKNCRNKAVKKQINEILKMLKKTGCADKFDNKNLVTLSRIHNNHRQIKGMSSDKVNQVRAFINDIRNTGIPFPQSKQGQVLFNGIIKYDDHSKHIIFNEKWALPQQLLIAAFAPQHLPSFYTQWFFKLLQGKDIYQLNPLPTHPRVEDLEQIHGKGNLEAIYMELKHYVYDKQNRDNKLSAFLINYLPKGIEINYPHLQLDSIKQHLTELMFINDLECLIKNKASFETILHFIDKINHTCPSVFTSRSENLELLLSILSNYQLGWDTQQQVILSKLPSCQKLLPCFYQAWFGGLLKNEPVDRALNPLSKPPTNLFSVYAFQNTETFVNTFADEIKSCLHQEPNLDLLVIIEEHLSQLEEMDQVKELRSLVDNNYQKILASQIATNEVATNNQFDFETSIESFENLYLMHEKQQEHSQFLIAKSALDIYGQRIIEKMKAAIIDRNEELIEKLYRFTNMRIYFSAKDKINLLYKNRVQIAESWSQVTMQFGQEMNSNSNQLTFDSNIYIHHDTFKWLDELPKLQLDEVKQQLLNIENKLEDKNSPLKNYYQAVRSRLTQGSSFEMTETWKLITTYPNFKLMMMFTHSLKGKTLFKLDLKNEQQKEMMDKTIDQLLQSPYYSSIEMQCFWKMILTPYIKRRSNSMQQQLKYIEKFINQLNSDLTKNKSLIKYVTNKHPSSADPLTFFKQRAHKRMKRNADKVIKIFSPATDLTFKKVS